MAYVPDRQNVFHSDHAYAGGVHRNAECLIASCGAELPRPQIGAVRIILAHERIETPSAALTRQGTLSGPHHINAGSVHGNAAGRIDAAVADGKMAGPLLVAVGVVLAHVGMDVVGGGLARQGPS